MSFQNLKVDELQKVADFFVVDVEVANEDNGATKKELLAALAAGDEPVTWEDYKNIYQKAVATGQAVNEEVSEEEEFAKQENNKTKTSERDLEDQVLIKYNRKNPTFEVVGYTFTTRHPFKSVPSSVADYLVRNVEGFRTAMPSEVTEYYG